MKLILMRHGLAVERDVFQAKGKDDALRPLVPKGRERTREVGMHLADWLDEVDLLVTSPYLRAKQTALVLKPLLQPAKYVDSMELIPSAPPIAFAQWLKSNAALAKTVVAVGHSPQLELFASWCLSGQQHAFMVLKKSGLLALSVEDFQDVGPGSAELRFLLSPQMLR